MCIVCVCVYVCMYACVCMCVCMYACMHACIHVYAYVIAGATLGSSGKFVKFSCKFYTYLGVRANCNEAIKYSYCNLFFLRVRIN